MLNEYDIWRSKISSDIISGTIGDIGIDIAIGGRRGAYFTINEAAIQTRERERERKAGEDKDHTCVRHGCLLAEAGWNLLCSWMRVLLTQLWRY